MAGNVVVDDPETEQLPPRVPAAWFLGLTAVVVLILVLLPGQQDATVPPTSVTFPDVEIPEEMWEELNLPGSGMLHDVTSLADGSYVVVGDGPQVWRYDGDGGWEWMTADSPVPGDLLGVAPYGQGAVAVGFDRVDGSVTKAAIWRTEDGRNWRRQQVDVGRPTGLDGVASGDGQVVAWGWQGSARAFAPEAQPLLLRSNDGEDWTVVKAFSGTDRLARLFTVAYHDEVWYAGGYATGRPALWTSSDGMQTWDRLDTRDLPFGWGITALDIEDQTWTATLVDLSEGRARRWQQRYGTWTPLDERPRDLVVPVANQRQTVGVGSGHLWVDEEGQWQPLDLSGEVTAAAGPVAVGSSPGMQPRVWVQDEDGAEVVQVPVGDGGRWTARRDLGRSGVVGVWRVGGGWVIGSDPDEWWYLEGDRTESFSPPWGDTFSTIVPVGDEWVALPSMHWTSDGLEWEQRAQPWASAGFAAAVEAVTESDGRLLAVGRDSEFLWNVSVSVDGGRSWTPVDRPMVATPLWAVAGTPEGFVATAARAQGNEEVVVSADGRTWETAAPGSLLVRSNPPAALTDEGNLLLFDTGEERRPPRMDISALERDGDRLVLVAGGRMWVGDEDWEQIPLDPPHGMAAGWVHPLPMEERLLAVGVDRGRLLIYEWEP